MERIFYKKSTAILAVALTVVIIFLLCLLLIFLTQLSGLKPEVEKIATMVEQARNDEAAKQELLDYKNSNDYVIQWAIEKGLVSEDDIVYIQSLGSGN